MFETAIDFFSTPNFALPVYLYLIYVNGGQLLVLMTLKMCNVLKTLNAELLYMCLPTEGSKQDKPTSQNIEILNCRITT